MAVKYIAAVWEIPGLSSIERLIALCIADQVSNDGATTWCTVRMLSKRCSCTERTVFTVLRTLEDKQILARETREGTNGGRKVTKITFNCNVVNQLAKSYMNIDQGGDDPISSIPDPISGGGDDPISSIPDPISVTTDPRSGGDDPISVSPTPPNIDLPEQKKITISRSTDSPDGFNKNNHPDFRKVFEYAIGLFPHLEPRTTWPIHQWLNDGADPEMDIFPVLREKKFKNAEVNGFGIFTKDIAKSVKGRNTPLPNVKIENKDVIISEPKAKKNPVTFQQAKEERSQAAIEAFAKEHGLTIPGNEASN